ncbi:TPA: hypothetical protein ACH3X2_008277 [Trebouxia sp. C0005]
MESTAAIQARDGLLGGNVTGQPGWDRLCTQGNQQNACSILVVKTQADESFPLLSEPRRVLMLPEPHLFNFIKTHSVHNTASGWGATLSDSPPTAPGTPDFADYVKDNRLHSSCIDNNFCSAVTQSSQRHAQPQRSTQPYPLQFGTVKFLSTAEPAHSNTVAAVEAAMISTGSTQLAPKASQQSSIAVFRPASKAASPDSAGLQAILPHTASKHHDLATAQKPLGILPLLRSTLTGSGSADSNHAQAASTDKTHLESLLSLAMAEHTDSTAAAPQPQPQTAAQPSRMKAPSVIAASNTNRQQHSSMSPPAQSTTRSLLAGQRQACRSHASRRYNRIWCCLKPLPISLHRAAPLNLPKVPEDTAFLLSPNGTQQSEHPSLELNMVPQVRILRRPTCSAHAEPVIMAGSTAEVPLAQVPQQSVQRKAPCCVCVEPVVRPGNRAEAAQVPQQSSSRVSVHHAAAEPVGMPGNLAAVPPTQVLPLRILQRPSHVSVVKPVLMSSNNAESPQAQAQNLSAPHVRGTSCVIQRTRGLIEELWFGGFKIAAPKSITSAAITIQTALRGHLCRQRLQGLRAAAVKIQACWRAWFCRRNFLLMKTLAALVQPGFKGRLSHQDWLQLQLVIQKFLQERTAAAHIQAALRGNRTRQRFLEMKAAAIKIQIAVRRYLASERRIRWRAELALFRQERSQRLRERDAAEIIEAAWKRYKGRQSFLVMKAAATKIQTAVRRYLASERRIRWRAELALFRQERSQRLREWDAVEIIEAAWKSYKGRQSFLVMKAAATKIQAAYRCHLRRQRLVCLKAAALKIQTAVRGHRLRQQFLMSRTAAVERLYSLRLCRHRLRRSAIEAVTALQGYDNTRRMLTLVAQQRRQNSLNLALHPKGDADRAHEEVQVVTHPQDTQEVEAGMEAELTYAVQEAPDRILPATLEDVPIDAEDGQATGAAERDLSLAAQQAATAASASPEDMFDTQAWLREEYEATFSTSVDPVSGLMAVTIAAATFAASRFLKKLARRQQK